MKSIYCEYIVIKLWEVTIEVATKPCFSGYVIAQKIKFKCKQNRSFLKIYPHLLKKPLTKNFIFCSVWKVVREIFYIVIYRTSNLCIMTYLEPSPCRKEIPESICGACASDIYLSKPERGLT